jgi:energy-coupling factor transporter ATP-binding protein EcfA2
MVTHDLRMVKFVDRVFQMRDGKLVKITTMQMKSRLWRVVKSNYAPPYDCFFFLFQPYLGVGVVLGSVKPTNREAGLELTLRTLTFSLLVSFSSPKLAAADRRSPKNEKNKTKKATRIATAQF